METSLTLLGLNSAKLAKLSPPLLAVSELPKGSEPPKGSEGMGLGRGLFLGAGGRGGGGAFFCLEGGTGAGDFLPLPGDMTKGSAPKGSAPGGCRQRTENSMREQHTSPHSTQSGLQTENRGQHEGTTHITTLHTVRAADREQRAA